MDVFFLQRPLRCLGRAECLAQGPGWQGTLLFDTDIRCIKDASQEHSLINRCTASRPKAPSSGLHLQQFDHLSVPMLKSNLQSSTFTMAYSGKCM